MIANNVILNLNNTNVCCFVNTIINTGFIQFKNYKQYLTHSTSPCQRRSNVVEGAGVGVGGPGGPGGPLSA